MSFLAGFSLVIALAIFTLLLWLVSVRMPGEMVLVVIGIMIFGDALLAGIWYYGIGEEVSNLEKFRLGIGFAFCTTSFGRALYFMLKGKIYD